MTITHLDVLDRSFEKTRVWVNDLAEELGTEDAAHDPPRRSGSS